MTRDPMEVYECKLGGSIDQDDIDELCDVVTSSRDHLPPGPTAAAVAATLATTASLRWSKLPGLTITERVRYACIEAVLDLSSGPPDNDLRTLQAGRL
ncbi:MAG: hypothetical protein ACLQBX_12845 [Candidatus Limnocylindrales bacterium]